MRGVFAFHFSSRTLYIAHCPPVPPRLVCGPVGIFLIVTQRVEIPTGPASSRPSNFPRQYTQSPLPVPIRPKLRLLPFTPAFSLFAHQLFPLRFLVDHCRLTTSLVSFRLAGFRVWLFDFGFLAHFCHSPSLLSPTTTVHVRPANIGVCVGIAQTFLPLCAALRAKCRRFVSLNCLDRDTRSQNSN